MASAAAMRIIALFAFLAGAATAQPVASALSVTSHEDAGRNLLDLEEIKEKAKEHAEALRKNAPGAIAGAQDAAGKAWGFTSTVSQKAAAKATSALEQSMNKTMDMLFAFLKLSDEVVQAILSILFNLLFCAIMLLAAVYLPPDIMLLFGLATFLVGPLIVKAALSFLGSIGMLAAWAPTGFVFLLVLYALARSSIGQVIGKRFGWDLNGDGVVDGRDAFLALQRTPAYQRIKEWQTAGPGGGCLSKVHEFMPLASLSDVEAAMERPTPRTVEELGAKVVAMEAKIDALMKHLKV